MVLNGISHLSAISRDFRYGRTITPLRGLLVLNQPHYHMAAVSTMLSPTGGNMLAGQFQQWTLQSVYQLLSHGTLLTHCTPELAARLNRELFSGASMFTDNVCFMVIYFARLAQITLTLDPLGCGAQLGAVSQIVHRDPDPDQRLCYPFSQWWVTSILIYVDKPTIQTPSLNVHGVISYIQHPPRSGRNRSNSS